MKKLSIFIVVLKYTRSFLSSIGTLFLLVFKLKSHTFKYVRHVIGFKEKLKDFQISQSMSYKNAAKLSLIFNFLLT